MDGSLGKSYIEFEEARPYLTMDGETLQRQYSPSVWCQRQLEKHVVQDHIDQCTQASKKAKETVPHQEGVVYGPGKKQKMDVFAPDSLKKDAPVYVYIHGGYWQALSREMSSYPAQHIVEAGAVYIAIGYDLAPQAGMQEMVDEVRDAIKAVINLAKDRGSRGVYIGGHSAGGHLAAMMLSQDWDEVAGEGTQCLIKGALLLSGVFDVRPLVNTDVNDLIQMDNDEAWRNSPWNPDNLKPLIKNCRSGVKILVGVGEHDSPEFLRQSRDYCKVLQENGISSDYFEVKDTDHFDVNDLQRKKDFIVSQKLLHLMGL